MRLFDDRYKTGQWPYGSGIWGKKEWVLPEIADENIVSLYEGGTNLFWTKRLGEGPRPARPLGQAVRKQPHRLLQGPGDDGARLPGEADDRRRACRIKAVACASTGDTSAALAAYCAAAGIPSVVFLPKDKVSVAQLIQPISNGSIVLSLDTDFDGCMKIVQEVTEDKCLYLANSMNSLRIEGQKTISIEMCQQFGWEVPDVIIIPGGNLGNVSALGAGFDMMLELGLISTPAPHRGGPGRTVPTRSTWPSSPAGTTSPPSPPRRPRPPPSRSATRSAYRRPSASSRSTTAWSSRSARSSSPTPPTWPTAAASYCPHTGVAIGALIQMKERGVDRRQGPRGRRLHRPRPQVLGVQGRLPPRARSPTWRPDHANLPVELPADFDAVRRAIDTARGQPGLIAMSEERDDGPSTRGVHGGEPRPKGDFSMTPPLVQSSTYTFPKTPDLVDFMEGRSDRGEEYGRYGNPTRQAVEAKLAALEGAEAACLFSSGMAAVTTTLLAMLRSDSHVVFTNDCYRKTRQFADTVLKKLGVACDLVPPDVEAIEAALRPSTRLIFTESPTNPYLSVVDLEKLVALARARRIKTVIDSTFATPFNQRPLELGVDLVIHSATKYLGGHNDLLAGCILGGRGPGLGHQATSRACWGQFPIPRAATCWAAGLKTFALRMARQNASGQAIAEFLERTRR